MRKTPSSWLITALWCRTVQSWCRQKPFSHKRDPSFPQALFLSVCGFCFARCCSTSRRWMACNTTASVSSGIFLLFKRCHITIIYLPCSMGADLVLCLKCEETIPHCLSSLKTFFSCCSSSLSQPLTGNEDLAALQRGCRLQTTEYTSAHPSLWSVVDIKGSKPNDPWVQVIIH